MRLPTFFGSPAAALALSVLACGACDRSSGTPEQQAASDRPPASTALARAGLDAGPTGEPPASRRARLEAAHTTQEILKALSPDCLPCAEKAGCLDPTQIAGGVCESVAGKAKSGATEVDLCLRALKCVFRTKCANNEEESQCLCGAIDIMDCMQGKAQPVGTCVDIYKEEFGDDGKTMYTQFINEKFGAGRANQIIQCAIPSCGSCRIP